MSKVTLKQLQSWATVQLEQGQIPEPRRDARLIIRHGLDLSDTEFYLRPDQPVGPEREKVIRQAVLRRQNKEPLAYVLGKTIFFGLPFDIEPGVLIPRSDSEVLIEAALEFVRQSNRGPDLVIGDLCTGSGCLGISLAVCLKSEHPQLRLWLTELEAVPLRVAQANIRRHDLAKQARLHQANLFPPEPQEKADVVLANPPYVRRGELPGLDQAIVRHEPHAALDGGTDGLCFYRRIAAGIERFLQPGGLLLLEHGWDQAGAVRSILQASGRFDEVTSWRDYGGHERASGGIMQNQA